MTLDDPEFHTSLRALGYSNADIILMKDVARHASKTAFKAALTVVDTAPENMQPVTMLLALTEISLHANNDLGALARKLQQAMGGP